MKFKITSRINFFEVGLLFVFGVLLFITIGVILILMNVQKNGSYIPEPKMALGIIFCIMCSIFFLYHIITKIPKITVSEEGVEFKTFFKNNFYLWSNIESVFLTGKQSGNIMFFGMPLEATTINLKDNSKRIIWAHYYRNIPELRRGFKLMKPDLVSNKQLEKDFLANEIHKNEQFTSSSLLGFPEVYKGNAILSFNGFIMIGFIVFDIIVIITFKGPFTSLLVLNGFVFGFMIYQLNYFVIVNNELIVKNHFWPMSNRTHDLNNIYEVIIETPYRRSTSLRIIDNDFNSKIYAADSLSDKTWRALIQEFVFRKIRVRNEAGI